MPDKIRVAELFAGGREGVSFLCSSIKNSSFIINTKAPLKKKIKKLIKAKRKKILPPLYEWAETFIGKIDEDDEPTTHAYDYVFGLAKKLEKKKCKRKDYIDILFHIEQINYDEIKIAL
jgi:hypothetical protein